MRGYLSAYDAETGKLVWRTYTVPGDPAKGFESKALEDAAKTWHGPYWVAGGGGTIWDSIVYDPKLDLVYAGTGNGTRLVPRSAQSRRRRQSLSRLHPRLSRRRRAAGLALPGNPARKLGLRRHRSHLMLADLNIAGTPRKVIMQASKNGFFYVSIAKPASSFPQNPLSTSHLGHWNRSTERTADRVRGRI